MGRLPAQGRPLHLGHHLMPRGRWHIDRQRGALDVDVANRLAGDARLIGDCAHHVLRADAMGMTHGQQQSRHPWLHGVIAIRAARTIIAEASILTEASVVPWARATARVTVRAAIRRLVDASPPIPVAVLVAVIGAKAAVVAASGFGS
jgi:hypothetical protein